MRLQFGLGKLFLLVFAVAVACAWVKSARTRLHDDWQREQVCVANIEALGGDAHYETIQNVLPDILLIDTGDQWLQRVAGITMPIDKIDRPTAEQICANVKQLPFCKSVALHGSFVRDIDVDSNIEYLEKLIDPLPVVVAYY